MTLILALLVELTKEDIIRMTREGVSDEAILAKIDQERAAIRLSSDDIVEMKQAGVSERVINRLLSRAAGEGRGLALENRSHRGVRVQVDASTKTIHFLGDSGTDVGRKTTTELEAPDGTYQVIIRGRKTRFQVTTPAKLTLRGCDNDELEVLTAYVGEGRDAKTFLLLANSKPAKEIQVVQQPTYPSYVVRSRCRGFDPFDEIRRWFCGCVCH